MNYIDSMEYLEKIYTLDTKKNKESLLEILKYLDMPQNKIKTIHVAGTNGKGSTCAMINQILIEAGFKVGMFTSPHIEKYNERIKINGEMISDDDMAYEISEVQKASEAVFKSSTVLSFFETLTIAAFNHFYKLNVDYAVIEVGLGGRLDSTNVIEKPELTVITSIGFDHMHLLGNTLPEIAAEKAGIIKDNRPVVLFTNPPEVFDVVKKKADFHNAMVYYAQNGIKTEIKSRSLKGTSFSAHCEHFDYENINLSMIGDYQIFNAANTLLCVSAMRDHVVDLSDEAVLRALSKTHWAGRMEVVSEKPAVILDGAHNVAGAKSVKETFAAHFKDKKITLIVGILSDKQYSEMLEELAAAADIIIVTEALIDRALTVGELKKELERPLYLVKKVIAEANPKKAFDIAYDNADDDDVILVAGSLYLLGDLRSYILNKVG